MAHKKNTQQRQYEEHRRRAAKRQADIAESGQEIGTPPPVANPTRRASCERNFQLFCETYGRAAFYLGWSEDHIRAIKKIESAVLEGKLFALAMPRGTGKTSLCLFAVLWAALYGHHRFITLIAATERKARKLLQVGIYAALERNELLFADFPEVCYPIRKLERSPSRTGKQKCNGLYTTMSWTKNEIVLPTVELPAGDGDAAPTLSKASGTIITVCGLTGGEIRGQIKDMPGGGMHRPSLVLLDDPQTKASAKSPTQCQDRIELLQGDVLGMAGPDRNIAGMMPCTVIRPGDMADQILDTEAHPEWHGERTKLVYEWPTNESLWDEYASIRAEGLRRGDTQAATEFYRQHRAAMDAGSRVAWADRFPPDCISALQNAINLKLRDEAAFWSEYQNQPLVEQDETGVLTPEEIAAKLNRRNEGLVPTSCNKLTMFIDVQKKLLYYCVFAFDSDFTGYLVEYGTWPDQRSHYFSYREARKTLQTAHRGHGEEAAIYQGLESLVKLKLGRTWHRDDGASMRIDRCLIDTGYQKPTVELYCRQSEFAAALLPSKGLASTASSTPYDRPRKKGEEKGDNWRLTGRQGDHNCRLFLYDPNFWKSFLHARLAVPMGGKGTLSLWGKSEIRHRMLAEHWTSEKPISTEGKGRKLQEWKLPVHRPDNHLLDCAVGCYAAANKEGCRLLEAPIPRKSGKKRRSLADMAKGK